MRAELHVCPLEDYHGVLTSVAVCVEGVERRFLFDLGAGVTSLDTALAAELGLAEVARHTGRRMTGQQLEIGMVEGARLSVAGFDLGRPRVGSLEIARLLPPDWSRVDGVLALDVLADVRFTADFVRGELVLGADAGGAAPLHVRLHRQIPGVSLVVLVAVSSRGRDLWFELDNSNTGPAIVSPSTARALGLDDAGECRLDLVGWGPFESPFVTKPILYDGNLGRTFCDGRALSFDLARQVVRAST